MAPNMAHKNQTNHSPFRPRKPAPKQFQAGSRHRRSEEDFSFAEADERLEHFLSNHGFKNFPHEKRKQLTEFYFLLIREQNNQNFTRLLKLRDIAIKHFVDCMIVSQLIDLKVPLLDVGSGPGFPGIPLKICCPEKDIILAEGVQKRVEFLKKARESFGWSEMRIFGRNINPEFVFPVQGVITRAVEDIRNTLNNVSQCLQTNGHVYLMKGPKVDPEIQMAKEQWSEFYTLEKDIAYTLPETPHERRLLVYRKIKPVPYEPKDFDEGYD